MTGSTTAAGTTIAMTASAPATQDAAGYGALTPTLITGVESIPAFGAMSNAVDFQPLAGVKETHKGSVSYGTLQVPHATDDADAGQILLRTAGAPGNNALYSFVVTYPTGAKRCFQARVLGSPEEPGGADNIIKGNATIAICTKVVPIP